MSLFAALTVAVGGLNAQSAAISNISDNLSNTQTTGFKGIDTIFQSLVTQSNAFTNDPGGVRAYPHYTIGSQGNLVQSSYSTSLAISGQGFFAVRPAIVASDGTKTFGNTAYFTRAGDFTLDKSGYLVNGAGFYLTGYAVDTSGTVDTSSSDPIQLAALLDNPVGTDAVSYSGNLPSSAADNFESAPSSIEIYDQLGGQHTMTYVWTKTSTNNWELEITIPNGLGTGSDYVATVPFVFNAATNVGTIDSITDAPPAAAASYTVTGNLGTFTATSTGTAGNDYTVTIEAGTTTDYLVTLSDGVLGSTPETYAFDAAAGAFWSTLATEINGVSSLMTYATGSATTDPTLPTTYQLTGGVDAPNYTVVDNSSETVNRAQISFDLTFPGAGTQTIINTFGIYDQSTGLTQFADTNVTVSSFEQNGIPRGSFQNLTIDKNGYVSLNYDNGRTRTIAQIPIVQFFAQDQLQRITGGAFVQTLASGMPRYSVPGSNGAGTIVGNSLEGSNVDIATEFTKLIQAQRVYSANARTITTADTMLQEVINIIR